MDYASRAGAKLDFALRSFNIDPQGKICADLGCSTGGFTDCLLQAGAAKIYAVDTGYGVLDWRLRTDSHIVVLERTNALHLSLPELVDLVTIDVGWTPQALIIPQALKLLSPAGDIITLVKPHYEAKKAKLTPLESQTVLSSVIAKLESLHLVVKSTVTSPLLGDKGKNMEFLIWIKKS